MIKKLFVLFWLLFFSTHAFSVVSKASFRECLENNLKEAVCLCLTSITKENVNKALNENNNKDKKRDMSKMSKKNQIRYISGAIQASLNGPYGRTPKNGDRFLISVVKPCSTRNPTV